MSKFLKFIVHLVIVCTIIGVLALVIPPFAGINTTIVDSAEMKTNLPFGSVTYAKPVPVEALQAGDSVVVSEDGGTYRFRLTSADAEQGVFTVKDTTDTKGEDKNISLKHKAPRVILTIGYLGFLLVAVQSVEGMIILGLVVLFLIILYIIAELWKKDPKKNAVEAGEEAAEEVTEVIDTADGQAVLKSKKELKAEEKERALRMKEEERQMKAEEKERRKKEKKRKKAIRTGGFVDEIDEEELYEPEPKRPAQPVASQPKAPAMERDQQLAVQMAPAKEPEPIKVEPEAKEKPIQPEAEAVQAVSPEPAPQLQQPEKIEEVKQEAPVIRKMAIPLYTAKQLQEKAAAAGDEPEIYQDQVSGVTLFDYSRILSGEEEA
ncbi:MAG: hypothetical protein ACOYBE_08565 [Blautia sp.]|jgi:ABC-type multidrug transport system fused ATPase/permease subunit